VADFDIAVCVALMDLVTAVAARAADVIRQSSREARGPNVAPAQQTTTIVNNYLGSGETSGFIPIMCPRANYPECQWCTFPFMSAPAYGCLRVGATAP
jgi:hypothetical protein